MEFARDRQGKRHLKRAFLGLERISKTTPAKGPKFTWIRLLNNLHTEHCWETMLTAESGTNRGRSEKEIQRAPTVIPGGWCAHSHTRLHPLQSDTGGGGNREGI